MCGFESPPALYIHKHTEARKHTHAHTHTHIHTQCSGHFARFFAGLDRDRAKGQSRRLNS